MKMLTEGRLADSVWWVEDKDYPNRSGEATIYQFYAAPRESAFDPKRDIPYHPPDPFQRTCLTRYDGSCEAWGEAMKRREFIALAGGAATAWPLAARAQQQTPLIGFLNGQTAAGYTHIVAAFKQGLNETGFVEGQNVTIEYRWADQHVDRLPELAADLVRIHPTVLVATGGSQAAVIAATKTIPIVASFGGDPVKLGYVASLNHPGGNVTGVTIFSADLEAKRLELMNEVLPRGATIGYLYDPSFDFADAGRRNAETAARTIGREVRIVEASKDADLEKAFATLAEAHVGGVVMAASALTYNLRDHLLALTTRLRLPAVHETREF